MSLFWLNQDRAVQLIYSYKDFILNNFIYSLCIFSAIFLIGQVLMFPTALFAVGCGIVFGTYFDGNILAYFPTVLFWLLLCGITGLVPLNISIYLFRDKLKKYVIDHNTQMKNFGLVLSRYGTKALFLIRLSPLLPSTIYNYFIAGFNGKQAVIILVSNRMYFLSTFGSFPGALFYIYVGYNAINLDDYMDKTNKNSIFL